jgi:hypothetical protein
MMSRSAHLLAAFVAVACAGSPRPAATSARPVRCEAVQGPATPAESIVVVTTMTILPGQLRQSPDVAERFLAAHAYETLLRMDCTGGASAGLSTSWRADSSRTRWTFTLREGARFWNGDPVTAEGIVDAWRATAASPSGMLAQRIAEATTVLNAYTLVITLPDSQPLVLADPELTVARRSDQSPWPEGTGSYRVLAAAGLAATERADGTLRLIPVAPGARPIITIHSAPAPLARDLIDAGIDLLFTDDPQVAAYAITRPDYIPVPVRPDRTFALLLPARSPEPATQRDSVDSSSTFRALLARDAVRAAASAAEAPLWWRAGGCDSLGRSEAAARLGALRPRVAYLRDDAIAAALAARLAALASIAGGDASLRDVAPELIAPGARLTSVAMTAEEFARALRAGTERGYVVAFPHESTAPCASIARTRASAPWLTGDTRASDLSHGLLPLIDVAPLIIVRRGRMGVTFDGGGSPRISGVRPDDGLPLP